MGRPGRAFEFLCVGVVLAALNAATALMFWLNPAGGAGAGVRGLPLDDGWIHLVYARSIGATLRPEYNPGVLESGMTSPLWAVLNAPFLRAGDRLGINPALAPKLLSCASGALAALVLYELLRRRRAPAALALGGALVLSLDSQWCFSRAAGMEPTLAGLLILLALLQLDAGSESSFGFTLAGAVLARPECLLAAALLLPVRIWRTWTAPRRALRFVTMLSPLVAATCGWALYNFAVAGRPLPNSFYVKAARGDVFRGENLSFVLREMILRWDFFAGIAGVALYVLGVTLLLKRDWRGNLAIVLAPWILVFGMSVTHTFQQGWPYYWARYLHPVLPLFVVPIFFGLLWIEEFVRRRRRDVAWRLGSRPAAALAALTLVVVVWPVVGSLPRQAALFSRNCHDIENGVVRAGLWLRENSAPGEWVAAMDAGAIRFFSDRPVLDLVGLNSHEVIGATDLGPLLDRTRPAYFALIAPLEPGLIRVLGLRGVFSTTNHPISLCDCPIQETLTIFEAPRRSAPRR